VLNKVKRIGRDRCASSRRQHPTIELDTQNTNLSNNYSSRDGFNPLMPRRAPEGLDGSARRGDAGMHRVFGGLGIALPKTPFKPFGAQDQSGIGVSFLLDTFLWTSKEKYLGCRAETRHSKSRRVSDTLKTWFLAFARKTVIKPKRYTA